VLTALGRLVTAVGSARHLLRWHQAMAAVLATLAAIDDWD
jgi:hypothetical protein